MGDRANVYIQMEPTEDGWDGIGIYAHWEGTTLHDVALQALPMAMKRQGDPAYFARILIHNILVQLADPGSETGFGLWVTQPCDNEHPILVINALDGTHWYCGEADYRNGPEARLVEEPA